MQKFEFQTKIYNLFSYDSKLYLIFQYLVVCSSYVFDDSVHSHWAFPENNRAGGVEDLFFQNFMLTPCDTPLFYPCDSAF